MNLGLLVQQYELFNIPGFHDFIYHLPEKYEKEIEFVKASSNLVLGSKVLDVGCGTGIHLKKLHDLGMEVTGLDQSEGMLTIARHRCPEATFIHGDMQEFNLSASFDVILCMYGAINYLETRSQLQMTLKNFYYHLKPGGKVFIDVQWSDRLPNEPYTVRRGDSIVLRRWQSKQGKNGSDLYSVAVFDTVKKSYFLETHNLFFQDPFLIGRELIKQGFSKVEIYENYDVDRPCNKTTMAHRMVVVGNKMI